MRQLSCDPVGVAKNVARSQTRVRPRSQIPKPPAIPWSKTAPSSGPADGKLEEAGGDLGYLGDSQIIIHNISQYFTMMSSSSGRWAHGSWKDLAHERDLEACVLPFHGRRERCSQTSPSSCQNSAMPVGLFTLFMMMPCTNDLSPLLPTSQSACIESEPGHCSYIHFPRLGWLWRLLLL